MTARGKFQQSRLAVIAALIVVAGCGTANQDQASSSATSSDYLEKVTEKGPVKLIVRVKPKEPRLSDLVEMDVEVEAQAGVEIKPPTFGQAVGDFLVRDYGERTDRHSNKFSNATVANDANTRRFHYQLEPVHAGRHLIRSLAIDFTDNRPDSEQKGATNFIESDPMEVNVTSELGDQVPSLTNLDPMLPPRPLTQSTSWVWWLAAVITGVLIASTFWLRRKRRLMTVEPRKLSPEEIAHAALTALLSEDLPVKGLFKEFYLRLTGIVRHFIEGSTGLCAPNKRLRNSCAMRSREIFSIERSGRLKEFLEAADMVKYAGQQPDQAQIELSIARAREFVDYQASPVDSHVTKEV